MYVRRIAPVIETDQSGPGSWSWIAALPPQEEG
eukprot:COSAG01_NODE_60930_length_292_cov_0.694301_1_plen_32_part_01